MTTTNVYFNDEPIQEKTPVFLKVLCILTFVSCGISLISTIYGLTAGDSLRTSLANIQNMEHTSPGLEDMATGFAANIDELEKWTKYGYYIGLVNIALTLSGAMMMWKLKKTGFYLYLFGQVLPFISFFGSYSAMKNIPIMGITMLITAIVLLLFSIAFIIMYAVNLKHMK